MKTRPYKSYIKTEEENRLNVFIGKRLKQARKNIPNLTQAKIGKAIGVSFQQIQKYEKGLNGLNAIRLIDLSTALKIPYTNLLPEFFGEVKLPEDNSVSSHSESL